MLGYFFNVMVTRLIAIDKPCRYTGFFRNMFKEIFFL